MKQYIMEAGSMQKPSYLRVYNTFMWVQNIQAADPNSDPGRTMVQITGAAIAKDLLQAWGGDHPAVRAGMIGVFICKGDVATPQELAAAKASQEARFRQIVANTDAAYEDERRRPHLSLEEGRRAMEWLGDKDHRTHRWYKPITQVEYQVCPACGGDVLTTAHICRGCQTNIAVYLRDRGRSVPQGWTGVESEMEFLVKASAKIGTAA